MVARITHRMDPRKWQKAVRLAGPRRKLEAILGWAIAAPLAGISGAAKVHSSALSIASMSARSRDDSAAGQASSHAGIDEKSVAPPPAEPAKWLALSVLALS